MIEQYQHFAGRVHALAEQINKRFGRDGYEPICLKEQHHEPPQVYEHYRGADVCVVSSLHDGMNLVAKEFLAARDDEQGVLILSQFTGAARELRDALIVNPYDTEQVADAIRFGLEMEPEDRKQRMQRMRKVLKENNVYRWAGNLITELSEIRLETASYAEASASRVASAN